MILAFIFLMCLLQWLSYWASDKFMLPLRTYILIALILSHVFIFPPFFFPTYDTDEPQCGMPILGITLAFWVFGISATVFTHVLYWFIKIKKRSEV